MESLRELSSAGGRVARIVADRQAFSRPAPLADGEASVSAAIAWAIRSTSTQLTSRARVVTELGATHPVKLDETRLGEILVNLMLNAAHAIEPGRYETNAVTIAAASPPPLADRRGRIMIARTRITGVRIARVRVPLLVRSTTAPSSGYRWRLPW